MSEAGPTPAPKRRWFLIAGLLVLALGALWFVGSLAILAIGIAIERQGGSVQVSESLGLLLYFGWWLGGPVLMLTGTTIVVVAAISGR